MSAKHTHPSYVKWRRVIIASAKANPATRCQAPACIAGNGTLEQHPPTATGRPPTWDCGHVDSKRVVITDPSQLRPEVATCNRSDGARRGNQRRSTGYDWP